MKLGSHATGGRYWEGEKAANSLEIIAVVIGRVRLFPSCLRGPSSLQNPGYHFQMGGHGITEPLAMEAVDYQWTTGGHKGIAHQKLLDTGGFSEVHQARYAS